MTKVWVGSASNYHDGEHDVLQQILEEGMWVRDQVAVEALFIGRPSPVGCIVQDMSPGGSRGIIRNRNQLVERATFEEVFDVAHALGQDPSPPASRNNWARGGGKHERCMMGLHHLSRNPTLFD